MDITQKLHEQWQAKQPAVHYTVQSPRQLRLDSLSREVVANRDPPSPPRTDVEAERRYTKSSHVCAHISIIALLILMVTALMWSMWLSADYFSLTAEQRLERMRASVTVRERRTRLGGRLELTPREEEADARLLAIKQVDEELHNVWGHYQPRPHFLSKYNIAETDLYGLLRSMPKGGLLHVHDAGMFKTDLLMELTQRSDLWTCVSLDGQFEDFRFSASFPNITASDNYQCNWQLMSNFWRDSTLKYENRLRSSMSLNSQSFMSATELAQHMKRAQRLIHGLITFKPIWPNFLFRMLEDFYADGVSYVELRSSLPLLYDLEGSHYNIWDTVYSLITTINIFRSTYTDFIGIKLIYAPVRDYNDSRMTTFIENARLLKANFPSFFVGFDLINFGNECELPPLGHAVQLLHINKQIDFYFTAGESRCLNSTATDDNLIDALLLGSKRIGNAINLPQHPELLRFMKLMNVAVEVCPLSNHYMQYINDFRNHPAAYLVAAGFPIVVGSDYPYFWNATPLTDDFYVAFVGVATSSANLRTLKQLAMNSLLYSALNAEEKEEAITKWRKSWDKWVEDFVAVSNS